MARVGASCLEAAGPGRLLVADSRGCLHLFAADLHSGQLPRLQPLAHFPPPGNRFHEPACLEYAAHSLLARGPAVLLVQSSGEVVLSRLHDKVSRVGRLGIEGGSRTEKQAHAYMQPGPALVVSSTTQPPPIHPTPPTPVPHPPSAPTVPLQPWRLELKREVRTATASAKIRASLRPGVALERPEVVLCGGEDCKGG